MKYFQLREKPHYNLRYTSEFIIPVIVLSHSVYHGRESAFYLGPKLWELISPVIPQINTFSGFKKAIKNWKPTICPCRICKTYLPNVGFLQKEYYSLRYMCHCQCFYCDISTLQCRSYPSMLVVEEGHTHCSKSGAFSRVFCLSMDDVLLPPRIEGLNSYRINRC